MFLFSQVAACNGAGLCSVASTGENCIDSTRPIHGELFEPYPIAGGEYDYVNWLHANPMTWTSNSVTLYLSGYSDPQSGLAAYYVKFGTTFGGGELSPTVEVPEANPKLVQHTFNLDNALTADSKLYVTIWVKNNNGQLSHVDHVSFDAVQNTPDPSRGVLYEEKHSCEVHTCNADCTCAHRGLRCIHKLHSNPTCSEVDSRVALTLNDGWGEVDEDVTGNANCLKSWWDIPDPPATAILRFEWTFGIMIPDPGPSVPGDGIFDIINERVWYDINELQWAIHCLDVGVRLEHMATYLSYVKVWYSDFEYSLHISDGIKVDLVAPQIRTGGVLTDMSEAGETDDLDFTTVGDQLHSVWDNIFNEADSPMVISEYAYGTSPGGKVVN